MLDPTTLSPRRMKELMRDLSRQLESRLSTFVKDEAGFEPRAGRAAVAIMVREGLEATEMLMIRRATHVVARRAHRSAARSGARQRCAARGSAERRATAIRQKLS